MQIFPKTQRLSQGISHSSLLLLTRHFTCTRKYELRVPVSRAFSDTHSVFPMTNQHPTQLSKHSYHPEAHLGVARVLTTQWRRIISLENPTVSVCSLVTTLRVPHPARASWNIPQLGSNGRRRPSYEVCLHSPIPPLNLSKPPRTPRSQAWGWGGYPGDTPVRGSWCAWQSSSASINNTVSTPKPAT